MNIYKKSIIIFILLTLTLNIFQSVSAEKNEVTLEFFYSDSCPACNYVKPTIDELEAEYSGIVNFSRYMVKNSTLTPENRSLWRDHYGFQYIPAVAIRNQTNLTKYRYDEIEKQEMKKTINLLLYGNTTKLVTILVNYYYKESCGSCVETLNNVIKKTEESYYGNKSVDFVYKNIESSSNIYTEYLDYVEKYDELHGFPFAIIKNETMETPIPEGESLTVTNIINTVDDYYAGVTPVNFTDKEGIVDFDFLIWHIKLNTSEFSLPVLTIVLGILDSFNPCAFFILIFLLNILIYTKSRKRMLLIGSIFIFFSGLLYALFMFILYGSFLLTKGHIAVVNIIVGIIALTLGIFNIKDFFFFKKGATLSIPEDKKPKIFKQMRNIVKNPKLTATIIGTIILAATVNFYELLCTLGLPFVFTKQLEANNLSAFESGTYIFFYNLVYVIPLIVIVLIFVFTLGRRKITEWHGRIMKLMSGIMLSSFGFLFIYNYQLLENVITPILLLLCSLLTTLSITTVWKRFKHRKNDS